MLQGLTNEFLVAIRYAAHDPFYDIRQYLYKISDVRVGMIHLDSSLGQSCRKFDDPQTSSRRSGKAFRSKIHKDFENQERRES